MKRLLLALLFPLILLGQAFPPPRNVTAPGPSINITLQGSNQAYLITLTGNVYFVDVDPGVPGLVLYLNICQDGSGSHTWNWPGGFNNAPTILATAGACTPVQFVNSGPGIWQNSANGNGLAGTSFPVTTAVQVQSGGSITPTGTGTITATNTTPNLLAWYFTPNCNGVSNCTTIHADGVILQDCTTANNSSTVTCPDAVFLASDVGKTAWATTLGTNNALNINSLTVCPITTIATFNSATSVTLTAANDCTSTQTGTAAFFFGTKDGATISAAMAATTANFVFTGGSGRLPGGPPHILVEQGFGNTLASTIQAPYISISGSTTAESSAVFIMTPDFNWAGCTGNNNFLTAVCFGAKASTVSNLSWAGYGNVGTGSSCTASAQNKEVVAPNANVGGLSVNLNLNGICPGTAGL